MPKLPKSKKKMLKNNDRYFCKTYLNIEDFKKYL